MSSGLLPPSNHFLIAMNELSMSGAIVLSVSYDIILHLVNPMLSIIFTNIGEYCGSHIVSYLLSPGRTQCYSFRNVSSCQPRSSSLASAAAVVRIGKGHRTQTSVDQRSSSGSESRWPSPRQIHATMSGAGLPKLSLLDGRHHNSFRASQPEAGHTCYEFLDEFLQMTASMILHKYRSRVTRSGFFTRSAREISRIEVFMQLLEVHYIFTSCAGQYWEKISLVYLIRFPPQGDWRAEGCKLNHAHISPPIANCCGPIIMMMHLRR
jgi:hypothetical protein